MTKCRRPRNSSRYFALFSLFGSIWKHLEAFESCLFSLFWIVLILRRQISENSQASKCFLNSENASN